MALIDTLSATPVGGLGRRGMKRVQGIAPGLLLCVGVAVIATLLQGLEQRLFGRAWLESLVLAILVGAAIRTAWSPGAQMKSGIGFGSKTVLEIAVVLLGASVSAATLMSIGWVLLLATAAIVVLAIGASFLIGRALGLPPRMALLVACGNSICGNSAIAAVAPVIGAKGEDVTAAIAFTALLGVATVLGLPLLGHALHMSVFQFGVLSGLTVYAVPQVLAATASAGPVAVQVGALVKLARVLMLGPVCFALATLAPRLPKEADGPVACGGKKPTLFKLVPWFILAFVALAALRSAGAIPMALLAPTAQASSVLTVVSMAALGLCTDLRCVAKAGPRAAGAVTLSLLGLGALSLGAISLLHLA